MKKLLYMLGIIYACASLQAMDVETDNCVICYEMLKETAKKDLAVLPECKHVYHWNCLAQNVVGSYEANVHDSHVNTNCPLCNKKFSPLIFLTYKDLFKHHEKYKDAIAYKKFKQAREGKRLRMMLKNNNRYLSQPNIHPAYYINGIKAIIKVQTRSLLAYGKLKLYAEIFQKIVELTSYFINYPASCKMSRHIIDIFLFILPLISPIASPFIALNSADHSSEARNFIIVVGLINLLITYQIYYKFLPNAQKKAVKFVRHFYNRLLQGNHLSRA